MPSGWVCQKYFGTDWCRTGFAKLHLDLVVLMKKMSVLVNFLMQNTNLVPAFSKICPNLLVMSNRIDTFATSGRIW